jgi:hypothetical protein
MCDWVIYKLCDPRIIGEYGVRYVGYTKQKPPEKRFWYHISNGGSIAQKTHLGAWLRKMKREGVRPTFEILEEGMGKDEWKIAEINWISKFPDLTNFTPGGDAIDFSGEKGKLIRLKLSNSLKKLWSDPEFRARMKISTAANSSIMIELWKTKEFRENSEQYWKDYPRNADSKFLKNASKITTVQWETIKKAGCRNLPQYQEMQRTGHKTWQEYLDFMILFERQNNLLPGKFTRIPALVVSDKTSDMQEDVIKHNRTHTLRETSKEFGISTGTVLRLKRLKRKR